VLAVLRFFNTLIIVAAIVRIVDPFLNKGIAVLAKMPLAILLYSLYLLNNRICAEKRIVVYYTGGDRIYHRPLAYLILNGLPGITPLGFGWHSLAL
jgi:hypothetical protein